MTAIRDLIDSLDVERVLVIAPKRVAEDTWTREAEKWDHLKGLRISKMIGSANARMRAYEADADIYVINRENVAWLTDNCPWKFDMVVIDELSSFKSSSAQRFRKLRKHIVKADRVVGLTGTPASNGYLDLWAEMFLLDRGERLGKTVTGYRNVFFQNMSRDPSYGIFVLRKGAKAAIDRKLSDLCLSMKAEDYIKMPEKVMNEVPIILSKSEMAAYRQMESQMFLDLEDGGSVESFSAAALMGKLLQLANGFVYDESKTAHSIHEKKIEALKELLDCNENVLVFYYFQEDRDRLLKAFPDARILDMAADISDWNAGKIRLLLAHPASVGHGLNIQEGGHIIVWYGPIWSLELYQQANARLYRQGQKHSTVIIHHLIAQGTVDEQVMKALSAKNITQESLMAALKERKGT